MLGQIIKIIKLVGLARAGRMKRHHELGLKYLRGYAATECWWTLLNLGFFEEMAGNCGLRIADCGLEEKNPKLAAPGNGEGRRADGGWAEKNPQSAIHNPQSHLPHVHLPTYLQNHPELDAEVLGAMLEYLDGIGLLRREKNAWFLTKDGQALLEEPRGLFELGWAYEPCFRDLPGLLKKEKRYGKDLTRRITFVGRGSGRLCEQLPYPIMRQMVLARGCKLVLDLGCGDLALLAGLCRLDPQLRGLGIDCDPEMIGYDQEKLKKENFAGRLTCLQADMYNLPDLPAHLPPVDAITACDTFHEYLGEPQRIIKLLQELRRRFPSAVFVIGEFCRQDPAWLRRHPTASLEHHLFHQLSNQRIGSAAEWRELFAAAGLRIEAEQVFDIIGHGYFALR